MLILCKGVRVNDGDPIDHVRVDKQRDCGPIAYKKQREKSTQNGLSEVDLHPFANLPLGQILGQRYRFFFCSVRYFLLQYTKKIGIPTDRLNSGFCAIAYSSGYIRMSGSLGFSENSCFIPK